MSSCGDGRLARPSGAKLRPHCPTTNPAKFLHLQVLMWQDLPKNYTTFGAAPEQATVASSGSAERSLLGGAGFAFGRHSGLPCFLRRPILTVFSRCSSGGLRSPQRQQRNLRRHANPHRKAKCPKPPVHIERSLLQTVASRRSATMPVSRNRQPIKPCDER